MKPSVKIWMLLALSLVMALNFSCGGSGGGGGGGSAGTTSQTISGVAAAGAPIIGFAYLKDKNNKEAGPVNIDPLGNFSFTLDATYISPFILKADGAAGGESYTLYSASTGSGTANINPFTNLAVAQATNQDPATLYANPSASSASITSAALQSAINNIKTMLQPLLTASNINTFDPLSGPYTANGTGLDRVLDVVKVEVKGKSVTLTNKTINTQISTGLVSNLPSPIDTSTAAQMSTAMTDLDEIATALSAFATALNKGANLTANDLEPFYVGSAGSPDAYGYDNGFDRKQNIDATVNNFSQSGVISQLGGIKEIKNLTVVKKINPAELSKWAYEISYHIY